VSSASGSDPRLPAPLRAARLGLPAPAVYAPDAVPSSGGAAVPPVLESSIEPIGGIPGSGSPRPAGPQWPADPAQAVGPSGPVRMPGPVPPVTVPPVSPVDGMNPADDAALRELVRLLGTSLSLAGGPEEVAGRLRAALVQAQPVLFARLPGSPTAQVEQLAEALTWLVQHLDQPAVLVTGCARLGAALAECGMLPQQLPLAGAALAEAMRAGMAAGSWRQDFDQAWRSTWQHAYEWIAHGMTSGAYRPAVWTAVVVAHERRRDDLAVLHLRPYLPMPFRPGQYARLEVPGQPGVWRPYSLTGAPRRDNVVEVHVRAKSHSGVSGTLVYRTAVGDKVRIARAEGDMGLPESGRDLLMIAGDTGVVPLKAMLTELAETADARSAVLFWGVRDLGELYDIDDITRIARSCRRATVIPVISEGESGPYAAGLVTDAVAAYGEWSGHEVYLAGPPLMLLATGAALQQLGVAPERIHHDPPG
jgi:NAD(P)H-flavin reductase/hemoglobin-like flavoprotein